MERRRLARGSRPRRPGHDGAPSLARPSPNRRASRLAGADGATHPPGVEPEHALDDAIQRFRHMNLALAATILVTFGMTIVVELHADRLVDRRDGALDLDAALSRALSITLSLHDFAQSATASTSFGSAPNIEANSVLDR